MIKSNQPLVLILLSTFNGESFLEELLESLINQTYSNWELWIRDDGSTDNSIDIIKKFSYKYYNIKLISETNTVNLGAKQSFSDLIKKAFKESDADYFCFCDQDDVWFKNKIEASINEIQKLKTDSNENIPLLVFSELIPVNRNLSVINASFYQQSNLIPTNNLNHLILHNFVVGCTMMFNRKLLDIAYDIPECERMHDSWFALIAYSCGFFSFINKSLLYYRIHNDNVFGVSEKNMIKNLLKKRITINDKFCYVCDRAGAVLNLGGPYIHEEKKEILYNFYNLNKMNRIKRIYYVIQKKMLPQKNFRCIFWIIILLFSKKINCNTK